ncbi:MAG TPA: hypothetical protein VMS40_03430, partial [Vicinamibacterales bacterium]|nr:hypothetical protein [Vicinamibacterales bacterium]
MVMLNSARIAGHFNLQVADLDGDGGPALLAEAATIGGDVTLGGGVAARGPVGMSGTSIGGELDMSGAILSGRIGRERDGVASEFCDAFHGRNLSVGSDTFLSDGFIAHGCVWLDGARIGGHLDLRGATLAGTIPNQYKDKFAVRRGAAFLPSTTTITALSCSDMSVGGCARIGSRRSSRPNARMFCAHGSVNLQRASVGKDLDIINARIARTPSESSDLPVLDLGWAAVSGTLIFEANNLDGVVHLEHASTNVLSDDKDGYKNATNLALNGFRYETFHEPPGDRDRKSETKIVEKRKAWLRRMRPYRPQPYANLASVFMRHGRSDEARDILVEKYRREREVLIALIAGAVAQTARQGCRHRTALRGILALGPAVRLRPQAVAGRDDADLRIPRRLGLLPRRQYAARDGHRSA